MTRLRPRRPSAALIVSIIALVAATGGTAYSAFRLPNNSVGSAQLRSGAVTTGKLKNGAVTGSKVALATLGTVPSAANANHANAANSANTANTANGAPPTGAAGGALAGSYPNPGLAGPEAVHRIGAPGEPAFQACHNSDSGFETAGFYKDGFGIVHLVGDITACAASGDTVFTLPVGYRPATIQRFLIEDGNTDGAVGDLKIDTDGTVATFVTKAPVINGITFRAG